MKKKRFKYSYNLPEEYQFEGTTGQVRRFNHTECDDHRESLVVTIHDKGWIYHCHHCGKFSGFRRYSRVHTPQNTADKINKAYSIAETTVMSDSQISLPRDFSGDIPKQAMAWLLGYGLTEGEIKRAGIGWSEGMRRLILPVYNEHDELVTWQGRTFDKVSKENPKYKNLSARGRHYFYQQQSSNNQILVLVEDIISAMKVGRVCHTISLLGSHIPEDFYQHCIDYDAVVVWLDGDKYKEGFKYSKQLRSMGVPCRQIYTDLDPKDLPMLTINELLTSY